MSPAYKAVILIGGPQKGTRFRPLSLECPKPLFPIAGYPTIEHHIDQLVKVGGLKEILLIGFYQPSEIQPFVQKVQRENASVHVRYLQEFTPLGTAGGLYHFRDQVLVGKPDAIFVINADVCGDLPLPEMAEFARTQISADSCCTIMTTEATRDQSLNFGCVVVDDKYQVLHYVEKPSTFVSSHISCGIYLVTPAIKEHLAAAFQKRAEVAQAESLTNDVQSEAVETLWFERDIFPLLASSGKFHAYHSTRWWSQIKTAAAAVYSNRHCLALYRQNHPDRLYVKPENESGPVIKGDVYIHPSANVDPSADLGPNVSIGKNCTIGRGVRIRESIVLDGSVIQDHACVLYAIVGWNSIVGQWARIEGTPIGPNPNMPFAKMENKPLFKHDGRLNPAITILGCGVQVPRETIVLNSVVLPHKELTGSYKNQIIL